ncbi:MAG: Fe2+-dependent dioxygenase [Bryobacteraceae bacterium]
MELQVLPVLSTEEVQRFVAELSRATFVDGRATAVGVAQDVKQNLQLPRAGNEWAPLDEIVFSALRRNREFQIFAHPKRILAPTYSRYEPGMHYGTHIDGAIMGAPHPMRTDLAVTIFLSAPESYEGGELIIELPLGEQEVKLAAGEAVVYPATTLHRVAPVTRGMRQAAVTWIQCAVRDERIRAVLYDLSKAVDRAEAAQDKEGVLLLSKCYHNLLRYAVDP